LIHILALSGPQAKRAASIVSRVAIRLEDQRINHRAYQFACSVCPEFELTPPWCDFAPDTPEERKNGERCDILAKSDRQKIAAKCSAGRLGKIVFGDQQVTLLGNARRIAKPRANHMRRELTLQFRLPAGPPLLKRNRMEQSWPTRDAGASQQSRHFGP
jgi:hypothetical protein